MFKEVKPVAAPAAAAPTAPSSGITVAGFQASALLDAINNANKAAKDEAVKKVKAVFQFDIKNADGKAQSWVLDLKNDGSVKLGTATADITIGISDKDFVDLAAGKANGQKLFMGGKLKVKGNVNSLY